MCAHKCLVHNNGETWEGTEREKEKAMWGVDGCPVKLPIMLLNLRYQWVKINITIDK